MFVAKSNSYSRVISHILLTVIKHPKRILDIYTIGPLCKHGLDLSSMCVCVYVYIYIYDQQYIKKVL